MRSTKTFTLAVVALFAGIGGAQAATYNVSSDWLATYPTTTLLNASHSATWGAGSAWSAGQLSSNFTGDLLNTYGGQGYNTLTTYYNASTGYTTSGATITGTYNYTVPFQAYQLNPGTTFQLAVGPTLTHQIASGALPYSGAANSLTLPPNTTVSSSTTTSGTIQEVGHVEKYLLSANVQGFDTTGWSGSSFHDGAGTIFDSPAGVFYNYSTNAASSLTSAFNAPSGAGDPLATGGPTFGTVTLNATLTPSYVAWTAPSNGSVNINMNAWDVGTNSYDGLPSFYVITSAGGPTAPLLSAVGFYNNGGSAENDLMSNHLSATQGTVGTLGVLSAFTGNVAPGTQLGISWQSGAISVTAGETIYFVADDSHTYTAGWTAHAYEGFQDPIALNDVITFTPEPSSFVLLGMAGFGLALAAWKRRRAA